jgi:hypothetical protein|tara:strand:+ start:735 stop:992 length:258 start_codon:yes stop_codon:yes gene_type:complete
MIPIFKVPMGKGQIALLTETIGGAMSNSTSPELTDVYTDTFPDGVTVDITINDFVKIWLTCYCCELEELEGEIEFLVSDQSDKVH